MDEATVKKIHEARRYLSSLPDFLLLVQNPQPMRSSVSPETLNGLRTLAKKVLSIKPWRRRLLDAELDSGPAAVATMDPEGGLDWLDEGLPDLSSVSHHHFDLAKEFVISRYLDILADEVTSEGPRRNIAPVPSASRPESGVDKSNDASTVTPLASVWAM